MSIKVPKYVIQQSQAPKSFLQQHWLAVTLVILAVLAFLIGRYYNIDLLNAFQGQKQTWDEMNQQLSAEVEQSRKTIRAQELQAKINQQALSQLQDDLAASVQEISKLKAELVFYENLLSNKNRITKLRVFELTARAVGELVELKMVLAQKIEKARITKGEVKLTLTGIKDDQAVELDLVEQFKLNNAYEFKYFQIMNHIIKPPEGFIPTALLVELQGDGKNTKVISERFLWSDIFKQTTLEPEEELPIRQTQ